MSILTLPPAPVSPRERLPTTFTFALLVHAAVILGVRFAPEELQRFAASTIEVTLVREQTVEAPDQPEYLAQHSARGGGNTADRVRPRAPFATAAPLELPGLDAGDEWLSATPGTAETEAPDSITARDPLQQALHRAVTAERSKREVPTAARPITGVDAPRLIVSHLMTLARDDADPVSDVNQSALAQARKPRERFVSVESRESTYAQYLEMWRRRVERVGNANYPAEARARNLQGRLVLEIVLNADGTIRQLATRRGSAHEVLDDAAYRAVRQAAPFAPFPNRIRAETDVLRFLYEWRYEAGTVSATTGRVGAGA
jgi:protein TonB